MKNGLLLCIDMSWLTSMRDYFFASVSAFLGVLLGIGWTEWRAAQRLKADRARLRSDLIKAFRFNVERISQCLDYFSRTPVVMPNFRFDTDTLSQILYHGRTLFDSEQVFDSYNWQRYQLVHLNAKLDYIHTYLSGAQGPLQSVLPQAIQSLVQHLTTTKSEIEALLTKQP